MIQPEHEYFEQQNTLASRIIHEDSFEEIKWVAGADVAYEKEGDRLVAAVTVLDARSLVLAETSLHTEKATFPYIPGLFSFRELPPLKAAFEKLQLTPDLIVCDGHGFAHPRRFGLACHLGLELNIPAIGCGKTYLIGAFDTPEPSRGAFSDLTDNGQLIGRVLRTQDHINPVFVSIGHRISLTSATHWILRLSPEYRLPETTRTADQAVRQAMKDLRSTANPGRG